MLESQTLTKKEYNGGDNRGDNEGKSYKERHSFKDEKNKTQTILKLKNILDNSKINHKNNIMNQLTLKDAHIYCKLYNLSGQITGPLIENYIKDNYNMLKNDASSCIGDLQYNKENIEIKVSNGGKDNNKFNYVQLRMNHTCNYIFTAYYINNGNIDELGKLYIFKLNKENIKKIILEHGSYAHGTIQKLGPITIDDLNNTENDKEYSIRPKYGDKCWNNLLQFSVDDII